MTKATDKKLFEEITTKVYFSGQPETATTTTLSLPKPLVNKVEGPFNEKDELLEEMIEGESYIFKATQFEESLLNPIKYIHWAEQLDDGEITDLENKKGENPYIDDKENVCYKYKAKKAKQIRIFAYVIKPLNKVSVQVPIVTFPIYVVRYSIPGLSANKADDIANDMTFGKGTIEESKLVSELVKKYVNDYKEKGSDIVDNHIATFGKASSIYTIADDSEDILEISTDSSVRKEEGVSLGGTLDVELEENKFLDKEEWPDEKLFKEMRTLADSWADDDKEMTAVFNAMVDKFKKNEGGIFTHSTLTDRVSKHASFLRYCAQMEQYIIRELKNKTLKDFEDKKIYLKTDADQRHLKKGKNVSLTPMLKEYNDRNNGLALCIHDFWAVEVVISEFKTTEKGIELTYKVTLWDNFGLNAKDLEKGAYGFTVRWYDGFDAWFVLQHFRGYRPFLTKVEISKSLNPQL